MNEVVIRIIDTSNNVLGDLDLTSFTDFPLVLTKGIVNLDNLKARTGTYSKTFKVPNTKNNAKLLSNVDNINSRKDYRDALNRKPCIIVVNGNQIDKGFVQVSKVLEGFELDSYELVFFGNNIDWVKGASELNLRDIIFRNDSQIYNNSSIITANSSNSDTYDHAYPYVSRSGDKTYKPVYYLRSVIERGLNTLGWNINSSFLSGDLTDILGADIINRLVCDFDLEFIVSESDIATTKSRAELTSGTFFIPKFYQYRVLFNDDTTSPNEDVNGNFNVSNGVYTVPQDGTYRIENSTVVNRGGTIAVNYVIRVVRGGLSSTDIGSGEILDEITVTIPNGTTGVIGTLGTQVTLSQGDKISTYVYALGSSISVGNGSDINIYRKSEIEDGDTFGLAEVIPRGITLLDVINDFTRMFNIYYWTDIKTKTIYFEPRNIFFESTAVDWSDKLDISNKYEVDYVSTYKRDLEFKYKDLNNDNWLKGWEDANKRTYAKYKHGLPDRFGEGESIISLDLFSSSYAQRDDSGNVLDGGVLNANTSPITIRLWNEYVTNKPSDEISNYNPKIYLFNYGTQTSINGESRKINYLGTETTTFPYGIFETYENVTSDINLSFTGNDGLFSTYYSSMLKNIEEGGRLIAYFNLSNTDIENLDFRKLVYINRPSKVSGYYLVEQVIDFNPIKEGLTKVSLFKFENLGSVAIDGTQQGNNGNEEDNGNTPTPLEFIYVEDGSNLIEVWIENPVTGSLEPVYR